MKDLVLCNFLAFARESGTVTDAAVPVVDDPLTNYVLMPTVEAWEPSRTTRTVERRRPTPDRGYQTRVEIQLGSTMQYAFSLQEFTEMTFAELLLGGKKPVSGVFAPDSRTSPVRGWWIMQGYNGDDLVSTINVWGQATVEKYKFGENLDPYALVIKQLYSPVATAKAENLDS